jgi:hypothetical protein
MSEEIKPKKERKFLKALGKIGEVLIQELFFKVGSNLIRKIGGKKTLPSILFIFLSLTLFAQFPNTLNKQRLGFQTTGDGLVWRGALSDTASIQPVNNQNAWVILDTVNLKMYSFDFTSNVWNLVGGALAMPFDSITFNTAKNGTVGVGEVEYNDTQGSLIQGLKGGNVTNVIGQQLHQRVNNRTGATLNKGDVVYLSGSQGNRITVAKGLAVTDAFSANTFGVVAESIADNQSGFIITEGLITGLNTSALTEDSAVYLSPTVAGALTSTKPQAPQHTVYIGVCVKSNNGSGELFVKIRNGQELDELHDVRISSPVTGATLFYSGGLWRDTTAALLVSDTASMLSNYATKAYADTTGRLYARQDYTTGVTSSTLTWTQSDTLIPGGVNVVQVYRNGQILLPSQYTIPTSTSVVIAASSFKVNDNYTVIFPRGGGAGSGGGSGSLTSISAGTGITVSPNPITTTGVVSADLSVLMELTDTSLLNLTSRFNTKQNTLVSGTNIKTVNSNSLLGSGNISVGTLVAADTVSLSNRINTKLNSTDTSSLSNRINLKLNALDTASLSNRIDAKGTGTVTSVATGYGLTGGTITTTGTLLLDSAVVFSRIRDSIVDVAIGNDTIKILKQEYAPATTSVLTWTITSKFPIQSKAFILVFRNGQLLINDQYNLTDTNKITIVSNSFKSGANYTVVTVSGIGSVGTGVFPNPVYPEAGIAVSTGSAWASSIANNSSNWNVAFNDKINNAEFSGTNTKTLTLTQYDGGTFTPTFTDLQGVTGVTAGTGLTGGTITTTGTVAVDFTTVAPLANPTFTGTVSGITKSMVGLGNVDNTSDANKPVSTATQTALNGKENTITAGTTGQYFRGDKTFQTLDKSAVGLGNVDNTSDANKPVSTATQTALNGKQNTLTNPVMGTGTTNTLPLFTGSSTLGSSVIQESGSNIGIGKTPSAKLDVNGDLHTNGTSYNFNNVNNRNGYLYFDHSGVQVWKFGLFNDNNSTLSLGNGGNFNRIFNIANNGNIGINDTTPSFALDINGSFSSNGLFRFGGNTNYIEHNFDNGGFYSEIYGTTSNNRHIRFQGLNDAQTKYTSINLYAGLSTIMFKTDEFNKMELTNNLLVINEDSQDTDFRVESDGNANMVFVDASANHVGIGTNAPDKTLHVNGEVKIATVTATPSSLLGKDGNNVVGTVTLGNTLNLTSGTLNVNNKITDINTSTYSITSTDYYIDNKNSSSTTIILPLAGLNIFRELKFKNSSTGSLIANGNIIPLSGSGTTTTILPATNAKWCTLVSDGTDWRIMQAN